LRGRETRGGLNEYEEEESNDRTRNATARGVMSGQEVNRGQGVMSGQEEYRKGCNDWTISVERKHFDLKRMTLMVSVHAIGQKALDFKTSCRTVKGIRKTELERRALRVTESSSNERNALTKGVQKNVTRSQRGFKGT
jgi:hypothetical protein